jgi:ATP-binding cassette, subfamily C, bacterial CydC
VTATLRRLFALAGVPRARIAAAVVLGALTICFGVGLTATAGYLISRAAEHPPVLELLVAIVAVRFFGLARPLARYAERLASHDLAFRSLARTRSRVYERLEPLAPAGFASFRQGDLLSRFVSDVDALQSLYLRGALPPLVALVSGAVSVAVAAAFLPAAGLLLAAGLLVGGIGVPAVAVSMSRRAARRQAALRGELSAELVELFHGAPELVAFGREDERLRRVAELDRELVRIARRDALADGAAEALTLLVTGATVVAVLAAAVSAHAHGDLDRVLVAMLGLLALASFDAVQPLAQSARELGATIAAGRRVLDVIDRDPLVTDPAAPAALGAGPVLLALEDVRARYPGEQQPALDGFTLRLAPGRRVALVGSSGAGKTTVTSLLLRFLDPEAGRVTLNGRDARDYRQEDVRRAVALAGQDAHLFSASVRENVRLGRPEATDEEIRRALRRAGAERFVDALPDGWDTRVGEQGRSLSGGQRQRVLLARALLADAPVLVLDEPTAHLDGPTAERLMTDVVAALDGRSLLLITHRPEGLELVDEIVRLSPPLAEA